VSYPRTFRSEAEIVEWLAQDPPAAEAVALAVRGPQTLRDRVAGQCRLSGLAMDQFELLARTEESRTLLCLNPTLTPAQCKWLVARALAAAVDYRRSYLLCQTLRLLEHAGQPVPRAWLRGELIGSLQGYARRHGDDAERMRTGGGMGPVVHALTDHFWFDLATSDLDLILRAQGWSSLAAARVAAHPAATPALLRQIFAQHPSDKEVQGALASSEHLPDLPDIFEALRHGHNPEALARLAPHLSDGELRNAVFRLHSFTPVAGLRFVQALDAASLVRLGEQDLLALLQSRDGEVRLQAQALLARVGRAAGVPEVAHPASDPVPERRGRAL
jgi:hypothetical protein